MSSSSPLDKKIKTTLICDTLNLIGLSPYDRKLYEKEMENHLKKRLLGLDKQTTQFKLQQQQKLVNMAQANPSASTSYQPQKTSSGQYIYSKNKKVNQVLN